MSDETPVPGELAIGDHLAGYHLDEIIARGGMAGMLASGATPRRFALEPGGRTLLVVDTGSGQLQAVQITRLP